MAIMSAEFVNETSSFPRESGTRGLMVNCSSGLATVVSFASGRRAA